MSLIYTQLPPMTEDKPVDVGSLNLLHNNSMNLIKYWQNPAFYASFYGGHAKPAIAFDAAPVYEKAENLLLFLGRLVAPGAPGDFRLPISLEGAWKFATSAAVSGQLRIHATHDSGILTGAIPWDSSSSIVHAQTFTTSSTSAGWQNITAFQLPMGSNFYDKDQWAWVSVDLFGAAGATTVTLHEIALYWRL